MNSLNLISAEAVLAKVYSDLGIANSTRQGDIIEWVYECLDIANVSMALEEKQVVELAIVDNKAKLPCNIQEIIGVQWYGKFLRSAKAVGHTNINRAPGNKNVGATYTISYPYLITDINDGFVNLYYTGYKEDEKGFPLLPEYVYFTEGCVFYVLYKLKLGSLLSGKSNINEINGYKQIAFDNLATASRMLNMVTVDEWQDIVNNNMTLRPNLMRHTTGFKSTQLYPELLDECFHYRVRQGLR